MHPQAAAHLWRLIRDTAPPATTVPLELWPALLDLAQENDLLGMVAHRAQGAELPAAMVERLARHTQREARHHSLCFIEAERMTQALSKAGIGSVVLKGTALACTVYPRPSMRTFRDIDLLVRPSQAEAALTILLQLGYRHAATPELVDVYRAHHFHWILEGVGRPRVELHWSLVRPDEPYLLEAELLLTDLGRAGERGGFPVPHADGHVLHAVTSLLRGGFTEVKRLIDLDLMVRGGAPIRWDRVVRLAQERDLVRGLRLMLELAAERLGTPLETPLARTPTLGAAGRRLRAMQIDGFPLRQPPANWNPVRHVVRFWLLPRRLRLLTQFLRAPRFERHRLTAMGTPRPRRLLAMAKRAAIAAWLAAWQLKLMVTK